MKILGVSLSKLCLPQAAMCLPLRLNRMDTVADIKEHVDILQQSLHGKVYSGIKGIIYSIPLAL